jgi:hypothetical protein
MKHSGIDNFSIINRDQVLAALKRIMVYDLEGSPANTITSAAGIIYQNKYDFRRIEQALSQDKHFVKKFQIERYSILESLVIELDGVLDAQDLIVFLLDAYRNDMLLVAMSFLTEVSAVNPPKLTLEDVKNIISLNYVQGYKMSFAVQSLAYREDKSVDLGSFGTSHNVLKLDGITGL